MAYDADFGEWVREHLAGLGRLEIRRMFGGAGLYASGVMFAILDDGVLWLKTDDALAHDFEVAGSRAFTYPAKDGRTLAMSYLNLPETALDDADEAMVDSLVAPGHPSTPGYNDPAYPLPPRRR